MNTDPHPQGHGKLACETGVQCLQPCLHVAGGRQGLARAFLAAAVDAEERHHAIAHELVDAPARSLDRFAHLPRKAVEQKHHVIGQL